MTHRRQDLPPRATPAVTTLIQSTARVSFLFSLLVIGFPGTATAEPTSPAAYRFTLNGKPITPEITAVFGDPGAPAPGDVVKIGDFLMVLGNPGEHAFRSDGEDRLFGKCPGMDAEACVAVRVRKTLRNGDQWIPIDPLSPMTDAEKTTLRGIFIDDRPADLDRALAGVHWENTVLTVNHGIATEGMEVLPPLPADLRYLDFQLTISPGIRDVRSLEPLDKLVYLSLDSRVELDLDQLSCGPELRFFDIRGATLANLDAISRWAGIRNLRLNGCDQLTNLEFLKGLKELRSLNLAWTKNLESISPVAELPQLTQLNLAASRVSNISPVAELLNLTHLTVTFNSVTDLSPVGRLPKLRMLNANFTQVQTLPSSPVMPSLRRLTLISAPVSPEAVEAFQNAVPACRIHHTWEGALITETSGADRIRVRTGGTCHRRLAEEKSLFEIRGDDHVLEFLEGIAIEEQDGFGSCMCCGNPSFEIYRGEELITTLGFHHGHSLRWSGGWWMGDATLTDASAEYLCKLLAEHGHGEPLADHEQRKRRMEKLARERARCLEHITHQQYDAWKRASYADEGERVKNEVMEELPDPRERTTTLFTLYGLYPDANWQIIRGLDRELRWPLLGTADPKALHAILRRDDCPEQILQGVARRLFSDGNDALAKGLPGPLFEKLARWSLQHPSEHNRRETVMTLVEMKSDVANRILVHFLHEAPSPRKTDALPESEPEKPFTYPDPNDLALDPFAPAAPDPAPDPVPAAFIPPDGISEPAAAALLLAQHGYPDALTEIRKLASKTEGDERKILEAAAVLAKPDKR